ncbi:MAG: TIGR00730 family Rossman fold protein [Bacteroidota bacterium]
MSLARVCVFCGSRSGGRPAYADAARDLGVVLATRGIGLVTGGGHVGLMGVIADAVLEAGGDAQGVIPRALLEREVGHAGMTELHVVETMHQRKATMAALSDAFITLPGGIGTMEELFEVWTWGALGIHAKPVGLLNVAGYYDDLLGFLDGAVREGFFHPQHRARLVSADTPEDLLARLASASAP